MGKRCFWSYMSFPCKRCIATISNHDPEPWALIAKTLIVKRENSHNFYLESLDNCLHYRYDFIYSVLLSGELGVFGVSYFWRKAGEGGHEFRHQDGIILVRVNRLLEIAMDHWRKLCQAWRSKLTKCKNQWMRSSISSIPKLFHI